MEEVLARILQFSIALTGAFMVALWFALVVWTYRDAVLRSRNPLMQVFSTLIVVLFFIPGTVIYLLLRPRETLEERQQRWIEEEYLAQELDEISSCQSCNRAVRDEWIYCPSCRYQLRHACQGCGRLVETGWQMCAFCGVALRTPAKQEVRQAARSASVDSRDVSVLPASWPSSVAENPGDSKKTADGRAILVDADTVHSNGRMSTDSSDSEDETGELPEAELAEIETPALESGRGERSSKARRATR